MSFLEFLFGRPTGVGQSRHAHFADPFDDVHTRLFRQSIESAESRERRTRKAAQVDAAYEFLRGYFDRLAEEQAEGLKNAKVGDFTDENVAAFEHKLALAYRLTLRQADTRFGTKPTDDALEKCGFNPYDFRWQYAR